MAQYLNCPKCKKKVEVIEVSLGAGAESELKCVECGLVLGRKTLENAAARPTTLQRVLLAGYTPAQTDIMTVSFVKNGFADEVISSTDGEDFLTKIISLIRKKEYPKLVIIEVSIPIMNGINAALCMRAIEKGIGREKTPILFFTAKPLDEQFVRAIKFLSPAKFVPLAPKIEMEDFHQRIVQVVDLLKKEQW